METCSKCGNKLNVFLRKHRLIDGSFICSSCSKQLNKQRKQKQDEQREEKGRMVEFNSMEKRIKQLALRILDVGSYLQNNPRIQTKLDIVYHTISDEEFLKFFSERCFVCLRPFKFSEEKSVFAEFNVCERCKSNVKEVTAEIRRKINELKQAEQTTKDYLARYLAGKHYNFRGYLHGSLRVKEFLDSLFEDDIDSIKQFHLNALDQTRKRSPSNAKEVEEIMLDQSVFECMLTFVDDIVDLRKILARKNIEVSHYELALMIYELIDQESNQEIDRVTIPAYRIISKITMTDKKRIIKEYLKLGLGRPDEFVLKNLWNKFNLPYECEEDEQLVDDCLAEHKLDEFEEKLGKRSSIQIKNYEQMGGGEFEDFLREIFVALGYDVYKTKLSGDQGADLIVRKDGKKIAVQAKKYSGSVSNKAIQEIVAAKNYYEADGAMVVTNSSFTKSAMELALANNVELWDGEKLKDVITNITGQK